MSLDVDVATNGVRAPVSRTAIANAALATLRGEGVRHALVSITLLGRGSMARMNRRHLDHASETDVISFGFDRPSRRDPVIGDIYIAPDVGRDNARARGAPVREELMRLVVHGTLHVLGYDHPDGDDRERSPMWKRQERIVRRLMRSVRSAGFAGSRA